MSERPRILLDCDPGIDDAFAIFCALRFTDLAAVTTVSGNVRFEHTTRNALYVLELAEADVPVHRGAAAPLSLAAMFADDVHGAAGLGDTPTPTPVNEESDTGAVEAILDFCTGGDATIVATGPLTNIALAIQEDPSVTDRVAHLHWMGGSTTVGNVTPLAEFNAWADPHAVEVVMNSGLALTMYGLNLTRQVRMGSIHATALRQAGTPTSLQAADFLTFYESHGAGDGLGQPMHDPCALLAVTHPALFDIDVSRIVAHTSDDERRGMTVENSAETANGTLHNIARHVDAPSVIDLIIDAAIDPTPAP
jgi:inosine-uridine nucleoside N-ribohydrolase